MEQENGDNMIDLGNGMYQIENSRTGEKKIVAGEDLAAYGLSTPNGVQAGPGPSSMTTAPAPDQATSGENPLISAMRMIPGGNAAGDAAALAFEPGRKVREATNNFGMGGTEQNPFMSPERKTQMQTQPLQTAAGDVGDAAGLMATIGTASGIKNTVGSMGKKGTFAKISKAAENVENPIKQSELAPKLRNIPNQVKMTSRGEAKQVVEEAIKQIFGDGSGVASKMQDPETTAAKLLQERSALGKSYSDSSQVTAQIDRAIKQVLSRTLHEVAPDMKGPDQWYGVLSAIQKTTPELAKTMAKIVGGGALAKGAFEAMGKRVTQ